MQSESNPRLPCPTNVYFKRRNQTIHVCPRSTITSRNRGNLDRSSLLRGNRTKMVMSFRDDMARRLYCTREISESGFDRNPQLANLMLDPFFGNAYQNKMVIGPSTTSSISSLLPDA